MVKIATADTQVAGKLVRVTQSDVVLSINWQEEAIPIHLVARIWEADGATTWTSARTGALVIGIPVAVLAAVFGVAFCETGCGWARFTAGLAGFTVGAVPGALIGAAIGSVTPRWRQRYP